ncbi:hypothetical protein [Thermosinus carboxydivorans]|uniref:hypothetical protein n=1 Tax=Thermosinus carboxydivorans TaxID=261685 RepID=UPI0005928CB2|nr:hypothetical protein [Thermosinus carboxydivorans]
MFIGHKTKSKPRTPVRGFGMPICANIRSSGESFGAARLLMMMLAGRCLFSGVARTDAGSIGAGSNQRGSTAGGSKSAGNIGVENIGVGNKSAGNIGAGNKSAESS